MQGLQIIESVGADTAAIGALAARHLDTTFRRMMRGPGAVRREGYMSLVTGEPHPLGNVAIVTDADSLPATLAAIEPLLASGSPAAVLFPCGASDATAQASRDAGFTDETAMPAMAVDITRMAATSLPDGYEWARIGDGDDGRAWAETLATGYELPLPLARLFAPECLGADMSPDAEIQFFAVCRNGRPVSTSLLCLADGVAGIYCVATLAEERGKGLGAHATAEALRVALELGYRVGVLQSSAAGHSVYLRLGFGDYATVPMFVRMPG